MLVLSFDAVQYAVFEKSRTRLLEIKGHVRLNALSADIEDPIVIANSRFLARFAADGNIYNIVA